MRRLPLGTRRQGANQRVAAAAAAKRLASLRERLQRASTEEDVKAAWVKALGQEVGTAADIDLYTPQVLFEFKFNAALNERPRAAPVLAQVTGLLQPLYRRRANGGQAAQRSLPYMLRRY